MPVTEQLAKTIRAFQTEQIP